MNKHSKLVESEVMGLLTHESVLFRSSKDKFFKVHCEIERMGLSVRSEVVSNTDGASYTAFTFVCPQD